jgi:hypothetical protein
MRIVLVTWKRGYHQPTKGPTNPSFEIIVSWVSWYVYISPRHHISGEILSILSTYVLRTVSLLTLLYNTLSSHIATQHRIAQIFRWVKCPQLVGCCHSPSSFYSSSSACSIHLPPTLQPSASSPPSFSSASPPSSPPPPPAHLPYPARGCTLFSQPHI